MTARPQDDAASSAEEDQARPLIDHLLDLVVFAPLELALSAQELVPDLATRGRRRVEEGVTTARFVGRFAVERAQRDAGMVVDRVCRQAKVTLKKEAEPVTADEKPAPAPRSTSRGANGRTRPSPSTRESTTGPPPGPIPSGAALAIPGYDSLSASQVIARLSGLSAEELSEVAAYEAAGRGRRTILSRVAQLRAS